MKPIIGITIGDQAGIGSEIIYKALPHVKHLAEFKVIGNVIPNECITYGQVNSDMGRIAGQAIEEAVNLALAGKIDAIVTAPIHKEALKMGGYDFPGHTEMLAHLTGTKEYCMMLVHDNLRVVHVTTHVALKDIFELITTDRIFERIKLAYLACKDLGISDPYIAVAGLNPHSGDGGLFGTEEKERIQPAIDRAKDYGFRVSDKPVPADVVFAKALGNAYDCVVAMYHDQGHIPVKTVGFTWGENGWEYVDGVNITLGLPIIRTSPDHGVAFGKAGKGQADPTSMINAIKLAVQLAENKKCLKN